MQCHVLRPWEQSGGLDDRDAVKITVGFAAKPGKGEDVVAERGRRVTVLDEVGSGVDGDFQIAEGNRETLGISIAGSPESDQVAPASDGLSWLRQNDVIARPVDAEKLV